MFHCLKRLLLLGSTASLGGCSAARLSTPAWLQCFCEAKIRGIDLMPVTHDLALKIILQEEDRLINV